MKSTKSIAIFVIDNDILFLEDFKKYFFYNNSFILYTFTSVSAFLETIKQVANNKFNIVLINDLVAMHGQNTKSVVEILPMIKTIDPKAAVVILTDRNNTDMNSTTSNLHPDAFVNKGKHLYQKLEPTLNRITSKYELKKSITVSKIIFAIAIPIVILILLHFGIMAVLTNA